VDVITRKGSHKCSGCTERDQYFVDGSLADAMREGLETALRAERIVTTLARRLDGADIVAELADEDG
jgi:hypothetical protein